MSDLYLKQLKMGPMENFVYLVGSRSAKKCLVVDPAWDIDGIIAAAEKDGMKITGALATHYHPDHVGGHLWGHDIEGVAELVGKCAVPIYAHTDEIEGIIKVTGISKTDMKPCRSGDKIEVGPVTITTLHTPGHTPGSQCFLVDHNLVSGDTLFITGCGRVDLPGGNTEQMFDSLHNKLKKLPKDTILYPGHDYDDVPSAQLNDVIARNPYLQAANIADWRRMRG